MRKISLKSLDFFIFVLYLLVVFFSVIHLKKNRSPSANLIINTSSGEFIYPLAKDREINVEGDIGVSIIQIKNGEAFFQESPCSNHTCMKMGKLSHNYDWAACMPNNIFIHIEGNSEKSKDIDAITK